MEAERQLKAQIDEIKALQQDIQRQERMLSDRVEKLQAQLRDAEIKRRDEAKADKKPALDKKVDVRKDLPLVIANQPKDMPGLERRMTQVENKLDILIREIQAMRQQMPNTQSPNPFGGTGGGGGGGGFGGGRVPNPPVPPMSPSSPFLNPLDPERR